MGMINYSLTHSFIPPTLVEHLLQTLDRVLGYSREQNRPKFLPSWSIHSRTNKGQSIKELHCWECLKIGRTAGAWDSTWAGGAKNNRLCVITGNGMHDRHQRAASSNRCNRCKSVTMAPYVEVWIDQYDGETSRESGEQTDLNRLTPSLSRCSDRGICWWNNCWPCTSGSPGRHPHLPPPPGPQASCQILCIPEGDFGRGHSSLQRVLRQPHPAFLTSHCRGMSMSWVSNATGEHCWAPGWIDSPAAQWERKGFVFDVCSRMISYLGFTLANSSQKNR